MLEYVLRVHDQSAHVFAVSLTLDKPAPQQRVSLPVWTPGSYVVREFARHLFELNAIQHGHPVAVRQLDKCTWEAACDPKAGAVTFSWCIYAFDTSVRAAYLDAQYGFINGASVFLYAHGREHESVQLTLTAPQTGKSSGSAMPDAWQAICALPTQKIDVRGFGVYKAEDYDELIDSPITLGSFWRGAFRAGGITHLFAVSGAPVAFDGKRLLADAKRICEAEIRFWHGEKGTPPFKRYVFMLNVMGQGYGGLEHRASTALLCQRSSLPRQGERKSASLRPEYQTLLGLISHEYFHAWNVKRMRPIALKQFDYARENYTELLWFFEGFTSYYDDLLLRQAGLIRAEEYLKQLAANMDAVEATPGRKRQSVAQASFDAWIKYYRPDENTPNATVSYYRKGALVALCLDLTLRLEGRGTLDAVMRALWNASKGGPISEQDIAAALAHIGGRSFARELRAWVHKRAELPVEKLLRAAGLEVSFAPPVLATQLGLVVKETPSGVTVHAVNDGGAAQRAGVAAGDELVAVNNWRLKMLNVWPDVVPANDRNVQLLVARDGRLLSLAMDVSSKAKGKANLKLPEPFPAIAKTTRKSILAAGNALLKAWLHV